MRVHTVAGDYASETVFNCLRTLVSSRSSFTLDHVDISKSDFSFPTDGIMIVTFESLCRLPDNKHFPPSLHVVYMTSWDDIVQCAERIVQIVNDDLSVEHSRKILPWHVRYHGLTYDDVYDVENRRADFVQRVAHF